MKMILVVMPILGDRILSVKTSILQTEGQHVQVTLDYVIDVSEKG